MRDAGFIVHGDNLPNCVIYIGDHTDAKNFAEDLRAYGILVQALCAHVTLDGAFIRVNMNANHTTKDIERCVEAFIEVERSYNVISRNNELHASC